MLIVLPMLGGCVYFSKHTLAGACSDDLDSPIRNFCVVAPGVLWRGERPTKEDAKWLLEHDVGSVVSLQVSDEHAFEAVVVDRNFKHSVAYYQVSGFNPFQMLSRSSLDAHVAVILAIVIEAPKPVYVNCRAGVDRTGVVAAAYRVLIESKSREEAIAEMGRFHSPWQGIDAHYVRSLDSTRRTALLQKMAEWESKLAPSARIDCMGGKCSYLREAQAAKEPMVR